MAELAIENTPHVEIEKNCEIQKKQTSFIQSALGVAVNEAINMGLRKILPNFVENQIIEIKDELFKEGIQEGVKTAIDKAIDLGKSAIGLVTGNFNKISQIETAVEKGGLLDSSSQLIDKALKNVKEKNILSEEITNLIKDGKNIIKNNLKQNIKIDLVEQKEIQQNVEKYSKNWEKAFEEKNFEKMEKEYQKIKNEIEKAIPLEETMKKVKEIENLHNLIKNKGNDFNISQEELYLAKNLV